MAFKDAHAIMQYFGRYHRLHGGDVEVVGYDGRFFTIVLLSGKQVGRMSLQELNTWLHTTRTWWRAYPAQVEVSRGL